MNIKRIGQNMTEVSANGLKLFFSYETPVAGWNCEGAFKTDQYYSRTTTKHINQYLDGHDAKIVSQKYCDVAYENLDIKIANEG